MPAVEPISPDVSGGRVDTQFRCSAASRLPTAFLHIPTVRAHVSPLSCHVGRRAVYCSFSSLIASDTREPVEGALVLKLEAFGGDVGEEDFGAVAVKLEDLADEAADGIVAAFVEDQDGWTGAAERAA